MLCGIVPFIPTGMYKPQKEKKKGRSNILAFDVITQSVTNNDESSEFKELTRKRR